MIGLGAIIQQIIEVPSDIPVIPTNIFLEEIVPIPEIPTAINLTEI